jgi:hypothetical protein
MKKETDHIPGVVYFYIRNIASCELSCSSSADNAGNFAAIKSDPRLFDGPGEFLVIL